MAVAGISGHASSGARNGHELLTLDTPASLRANYRQQLVDGYSRLHRDQLIVLCRALGLDTVATIDTMKERIDRYSNGEAPALFTPSQAPMVSDAALSPVDLPTILPMPPPTCLPQGASGCAVTSEETEWFAQQSRQGPVADQLPNPVAALYLATPIDSVSAEGSEELLANEPASGPRDATRE